MIKSMVAALLVAAPLLAPQSVSAQECNCLIERVDGQTVRSPGCSRPDLVCSLELGAGIGDIDLREFTDLRDITVYIGNHASPTFRGATFSSNATQFSLLNGGGGVVITIIDDQGTTRTMGPGGGNNPNGIRAYNQELQSCEGTCTLWGPSAPALLPVSLLSWNTKAYDNYVELRWSTMSEKDNAYYLLLHSRDGRTFEEIATIVGRGTTDQISDYTYRHLAPATGINYYRIEQIDFDGSNTALGVQSASWNDIAAVAMRSATPNPARVGDRLNLNLPGTEGEVAHLIGPTGRVLGEYRLQGGGFTLPELAAGTYVVRVRGQSSRFLVAN
ncbi:hypothetical protein [Lewinella sp. JB7]|uniref:hypothetical protein n=1 Tax=Lewinella sp. JB7 TaxID=2962887 RepID=UPI0020C96AA7|nr:hypothetical protein [Lewinella sp. JB7]MCP9234814.1 hypothetical protein [Lewinella sp. JB7]